MDWNTFWVIFAVIVSYSLGRAVGKDIGRRERIRPLRFGIVIDGDHIGGFGLDMIPWPEGTELSKNTPPNTEENRP